MLIKTHLPFSKLYISSAAPVESQTVSNAEKGLKTLSIQIRLNKTLSCHKGALCFFWVWHCITYSLHYPLMNSLYYKWDYALFEYQVVVMHRTRIWGGGKTVFTVNVLSHLSGCQVSLSSTKSFLSVPWEVQNIPLEMKMFFFPLLLHFF